MGKGELIVHHLYHSGVTVRTPDRFLVFDYFEDAPVGKERSLSSGVLSPADLQEKNVYVFATHGHGDHFNPLIFYWQKTNPGVKYILSSDIKTGEKKTNCYFMDPDQDLELDEMEIRTTGSTDQGVGFLVKVAGYTIFHAGDLNWWHWKNFSRQEQKVEEKKFKKEVDKLSGVKIDLAFIPVDPRLEEYYYLAGEYFAGTINPEVIIPIHFNSNFSITAEFAEKMKSSPVKVVEIKRRGQKITYPFKK